VHGATVQTGSKPASAHAKGSRAARRVLTALDQNAFVILSLAACATVQIASLRSAMQSDTWYTLVSGRLISASGPPHHDTLTALTLGKPWVDEQWLAQLGFYGLWSLGAIVLAMFSLVVLYTGAFGILAVGARAGGASARSVAAVTAVCFLVGVPNTVLRAQVPGYVLFALVLAVLLSDCGRLSKRVYLVLPLLVLWANVHGSVLVGAALVSLYGLTAAFDGYRRQLGRRRAWRAAMLVLAPWVCVLVSPYGPGLPGYYRSVLNNHTLAHSVSEWGPSTLRGQPLFFVLLGVGSVLATLGRRRLTPFALLAFVVTGVLGLLAVRNVVWFAFVAAAVLPAAVDAVWPPAQSRRRPALNLALAATGILFACAVAGAVLARGARWLESGYPAQAVAAVSAAAHSHPRGRIFANERYADWLIFQDPSLAGRVAYDTRFELLTRKQLDRIVAFRLEHGPDWLRAANGYGLLVLDPKSDSGAVRLLARQPGTSVLYRDGHVVVLRRGLG
jgi:hypothetical protein